MKGIYEMHGRGRSAGDCRDLGLARDTVLRYLNSPEAMLPKRGRHGDRGWTPTPSTSTGVWRRGWRTASCCCGTASPEIAGGATRSSWSTCAPPAGRQPEATMRFETAAGEQAQVDWGSLPYVGEDGKLRRVWVFVMTMGWSRACYVGWSGGRTPPPSSSATPMLSSTWAAFPALPVRQRQGGDPGQGRGWPGGMEPADAGLRPAGGL